MIIEENSLSELLKHAETYNQVIQTLNIIQAEKCKGVVLETKFRSKFGLKSLGDALPTLLQYFYEMGLEEGKLKDE